MDGGTDELDDCEALCISCHEEAGDPLHRPS